MTADDATPSRCEAAALDAFACSAEARPLLQTERDLERCVDVDEAAAAATAEAAGAGDGRGADGCGSPSSARCAGQLAPERDLSTTSSGTTAGSGACDSQSSEDPFDAPAEVHSAGGLAAAAAVAEQPLLGEKLEAATRCHRVSLSNPGLLVWTVRQLPLVLLTSSLVLLTVSALMSERIFLALFVALNLQTFAWSARTSIFGTFAALFRLPRWQRLDWFKRVQEARDAESVQHFMIIPSYKEGYDVLDGTVQSLAESSLARSCLRVVLAMEERDAEAPEVARLLCEKWAQSFADMFVTFHPADMPMEIAGKSSNVNWAFKQVSARARQQGLDPLRTVVSITDADCVWHPDYVGAVTLDVLRLPAEESKWLIWQAPQLHLRNLFDVPLVTRTTGYAAALYELGGLTCPLGTQLSYSSYSMLLALADRVEGWDTDVIAEDWHMFSKCLFSSALRGDPVEVVAPSVRLQPVLLPVKSFLVDSAAGSWSVAGYADSLRARFVQARRHMQGINEFAYAVLQWVTLLRHHGLRKVPLRVHTAALSLIWTMLSVHNFPYCHLAALILAQVLYAPRLHEHGSCHNFLIPRSPLAACANVDPDSFEHTQCLVFAAVPLAFSLLAALSIVGTFSIVVYVVSGGGEQTQRQDGAPAVGRYALEAGGVPLCRCQRWWPVLFLTIVLELLCSSWLVMVVFGFVPEALAVWHLARVGVQFQYVCATKPSAAPAAPDADDPLPAPLIAPSPRCGLDCGARAAPLLLRVPEEREGVARASSSTERSLKLFYGETRRV
eukprot:TRINITY_DN29508_c0_g1_i1.p1 TRINITY_DN29508_c0_g1~~TRINITY_DN29508_c0_g1_i1.p1  ORF type:complete len:782 (-),score=164.49 TRINITY_DN29508_c0_g1_i1:9-2354(-)